MPTLRRLVDRPALIANIRRADLGFLKGPANRQSFDQALLILLADEGPSAEFGDLITRLKVDPGDGRGVAIRALTAWARARVEARR